MFNGIIYNKGIVKKISNTKKGKGIFIQNKLSLSKKNIGMSISCDGVCLTLISLKNNVLEFYLLNETINRSKFKKVKPGDEINLELPMKYGQDISGHLCQGHVDTTANVTKISNKGSSKVIEFDVSKKYKKLLIEKASILINGVSLTISKITRRGFEIWLIPHTLKLTNLSNIKINTLVNIEFDILSKYIKNYIS
tara:strand:- start:11080 stop:11664 length:585 start_codon:yes stop_codon:yes gene_type:complete